MTDDYTFHHFSDHLFEYLLLRNRYIEHEFIMHLEYHFSLEMLCSDPPIELDHRYFEDICCCPLYRHIHRLTLSDRPDRPIGIIDPWDITTTTMIGLDVSMFASILKENIIVYPYSRISSIERIDIFLSLRDTTVERLGKSISRDPIDYSEVDRLGDPPHMTRDLAIFSEEESRRPHMDILSVLECLDEALIL